jgi:hypoxanthine phosphoribosyltransferase
VAENRRLTQDELSKAARTLFEEVREDGFDPDVIVGVPTAGSWVAVAMYEQFPDRQVVEVGASRGSTKWKRARPVAAVIRRTPAWLQDAVRAVEHVVHTRRGRRVTKPRRELSVSMTDRAVLTSLVEPTVLVVDDAVDTGETLRAVTGFVQELAPGCRLRTAALSVTAPDLRVAVDHHLYSEVLLSGPWSLDER